jgi:hypothetical protein
VASFLDVSELSNVEPIGHPLARSLRQQSLTTAGASKGAWPPFDTELSKSIAEETKPQPAFAKPAL